MADRPIDVQIKGIWWWKKLKAKPGSLSTHAMDGDFIVWTIRDSFKTATLTFPQANVVFDPPAPVAEDFPASGKIRRKVARGAAQGAPPQKYLYTIFANIDDDNWQAEGDSPPEIIID